ncbi:MAG: HAD family phosphatase [Bacteroidales bacterium]|nr:HAD family phosphatase [Bacteroidales bacterium]
MSVKAVLFDLDGVLIDTEGIYTDFWSDIDRRFPTGVDDFAHVIKGNTLSRILDTYFPGSDIQTEIRGLLRRQENDMTYNLFDGAIELLEGLRAAGISTAIVTSSNRTKMNHLFDCLPELGRLIDTLVTDEDVTASKPDPQGYLLAARRLQAAEGEFVVFEDSYAGLEAGRRAGAIVVGVATTNPRHGVAPLADVTVDTMADITAADIAALADSFRANRATASESIVIKKSS